MPRIIAVLLLLVAANGVVLAAAPGESEYAVCVACHGASGEGNPALNSPSLAGQDASYLVRQLNHFKNGVRGANRNQNNLNCNYIIL